MGLVNKNLYIVMDIIQTCMHYTFVKILKTLFTISIYEVTFSQQHDKYFKIKATILYFKSIIFLHGYCEIFMNEYRYEMNFVKNMSPIGY